MKNLSILIIAMLSICFNANAADNYKVGDTLYVWAPSGLNVRTGPSTHYGKMGKLEIGDYVVVKSITEKKYITNALPGYQDGYGDADGKENHPYQLRGVWIEVESEKFYGYLVDIYLLKLPYQETMIECLAQGDMDNVKTDTLGYGPSEFSHDIDYAFTDEYAINSFSAMGGSSEIIFLPEFTIEEAYVWANSYYNLEQRNSDQSPQWFTSGTFTDKLYLNDAGLCSLSITMENGLVLLECGCFC